MFCNPSPPRLFLSLDLLLEYWIQHGAIGPLYVTSSYSTWIFCRGVSGFATDCPCDIWCRGLTTCLLHVGPPFGNWFLNTSWAVGLTYWIVYFHFFGLLANGIIYVLIHHIIFWLYLYFLNILYFFKHSCTNIFHRRSLCTFYQNCRWNSLAVWQKIGLLRLLLELLSCSNSSHSRSLEDRVADFSIYSLPLICYYTL